MTGRIQLEPEAQAFVEAAATPPLLFTLGPQKGRVALGEAQAGKIPLLPIDIEDLTIADGPSEQVALRILRPPHAKVPLPVMVYIHGAGWVFGSKQTHDRLIRELAVEAGAAVLQRERPEPLARLLEGERGDVAAQRRRARIHVDVVGVGALPPP